MEVERKQLHILVSGWVQGVGFRYFARTKAAMFNIKGYAKNLPDGKVEVVAEGQKEDLDKYVMELRRGPTLARVTNLKIKEFPSTRKYQTFRILW